MLGHMNQIMNKRVQMNESLFHDNNLKVLITNNFITNYYSMKVRGAHPNKL